MARKTSGLRKDKDGTWIIDKVVNGKRIYKRTGSSDRTLAETYLVEIESDMRRRFLLGERKKWIFRDAAIRYVKENSHKRSIDRDVIAIKQVDPYIGEMPIDMIYDETLEEMKAAFLAKSPNRPKGLKPRSVNLMLWTISRILKLAANSWRDENKRTWLESAPILTRIPETDNREPYPLSWREQELLISELNPLGAKLALFLLNTGLREQEACKLRWEWEHPIPEIQASVFVIPKKFGGRTPSAGVKNKEDRLVVLNSVARKIIDGQRGNGFDHVFAQKSGRPLGVLNNSGWEGARRRASERYPSELGCDAPEGFRSLRVHDLKHTLGRRLRSANVSWETRQVLLGHSNGSVTTHYSAAEILEMINGAEQVCGRTNESPTLTVIKSGVLSRKSHAD